MMISRTSLYGGALLATLRRRAAADELPDVPVTRDGVTVDRAHLSAYDRVCGFRLGDTLPATYPHVLAFPLAVALMTRPDFPLPLVGLVHVANRIELYRPLRADEAFDLAVRAEDLRPHERGRQLDVVAQASVGGEPVWSDRSTYLHREAVPPVHSGQSAEPGEPPEPTAVWRVERRIGADYAAVSGDHNPIHTSRIGARLFGFPHPIAHGMWSKARSLAALEGRLPEAYTVDVAFKAPILLPATVAYSARRDGGTAWQLALHDAKSGRPHLVGTVTPA
jgi:acyl dehydratase